MIGHYFINRLSEYNTLFCRSDLLVAPTKKLKKWNVTLSIRNGITWEPMTTIHLEMVLQSTKLNKDMRKFYSKNHNLNRKYIIRE